MGCIVLVGAPGAGKSTVGSALALELQLTFLDTDVVIEERAGKKISDIFVVDGEERFREIELEVLEDLIVGDNCVLSLGGGAPISERAQKLLTGSGAAIIFLDVSLATAAPRVGFNRDRPLLLGNPRAQWQALSDKRRPIYESLATHSVKVDDMSINQVVDAIIECVR
jgi:shikimate kinase